jgi:hypothetical protein
MRKCSRIGASVNAGRKVSAPTSSIVPINKITKSVPDTGNVPAPMDPALLFLGIDRKEPIGQLLERPDDRIQKSSTVYIQHLAQIKTKRFGDQ